MTTRPEAPYVGPGTPHPGTAPGVPLPDDRLDGTPDPEELDGTPDPEELDGTPDPEELARLRAEVSALHAKLDTRQRRSSTVGTIRRVIAALLVAVTAFALVGSVIGVWAARTAMNTDRWVATVAPLPQNPQVSAAVADYATVQIFQALDVEQRLRTVLPQQAAFVAGPLSDQLADKIRQTTTTVLRSERFQSIWLELNRRAHARAVAIINGSSDVVVARENRVEIDLLPLINQVLRVISAELPTLFGKQITLPDLSSGAIPANLRDKVQETLGITLPPNFAQFTVYDSGQLWAAQQGVAAAKRYLVMFVVATIVLLLIALAVSPVRRRTLLQLGLWLVVAAVAITAVLRAIRTQILQEIPGGLYRDGVAAAFSVVFAQLRTRGTQLIWIGLLLAVLMYLIGPGRGPRWLRHSIVTGARAAGRGSRRGGHALAQHGPGWAARHLDVLRVGGLVVGAALALVMSSWTSLLVIAVVLAAYEVLVTVVGKSASRGSTAPAATPAINTARVAEH